MSSLGEALPEEIQRVSLLRDQYLLLPGGVGIPAATMMRASVEKAIQAVNYGDVLECIKAYKDLQGYTG